MKKIIIALALALVFFGGVALASGIKQVLDSDTLEITRFKLSGGYGTVMIRYSDTEKGVSCYSLGRTDGISCVKE